MAGRVQWKQPSGPVHLRPDPRNTASAKPARRRGTLWPLCRIVASALTDAMAALIRENRNFRLLISGAGLANLSDGIGVLAFPWLATLITTDPRALALVAFATRVPWFLWSLPVGVLTDRADRQRMMVRADLARMALALAVVALFLYGLARLRLPKA